MFWACHLRASPSWSCGCCCAALTPDVPEEVAEVDTFHGAVLLACEAAVVDSDSRLVSLAPPSAGTPWAVPSSCDVPCTGDGVAAAADGADLSGSGASCGEVAAGLPQAMDSVVVMKVAPVFYHRSDPSMLRRRVSLLRQHRVGP